MDEYADRLQAKLASESVQLTLIRVGCFLSAYELIKSEIVSRVHDFFWSGFDNGQYRYDEQRYQQSVLSRDPKSKYRASCAWLVEMHALTSQQVATLDEVRRHRHEIAHELPRLLVDLDFTVRVDLLRDSIECIRALGVFWGSIEVDADEQWDGKDVDYEGIKSGSYLVMEYLAELAFVDLADHDVADTRALAENDDRP